MKTLKQGNTQSEASAWWVGRQVECDRCHAEYELEAGDNVATLAEAALKFPRHGELGCPACHNIIWFYPDAAVLVPAVSNRAKYICRLIEATAILFDQMTDGTLAKIAGKLSQAWAVELRNPVTYEHVKAFWDAAVDTEPGLAKVEAVWETANPPSLAKGWRPWNKVDILITPLNKVERLILRLDAVRGEKLNCGL